MSLVLLVGDALPYQHRSIGVAMRQRFRQMDGQWILHHFEVVVAQALLEVLAALELETA